MAEQRVRKWAENQRHLFIEEHIAFSKKINRRDLIDKFKISLPQASRDLKNYIEEHPGKLTYNVNERCYETTN